MNDKKHELDPWIRQRSVWQCIGQMARGDLPKAPLGVELHLGSACNLACPECISRPTLGTLRFSHDRAIAVARELVALSVRSVVISGGGEPLLHPSVDEVLRVLHSGGLKVSLVTNGTLLATHAEALVSHVSRLWVSVDASSAEMHQRFRPHSNGDHVFDKIVEGIRALAPKMKGRLTYSFLLQTYRSAQGRLLSNVSEIVPAAQLARQLGVKTFELNLAFAQNLQVNPLHSEIANELRDQLIQLRKLDSQNFRAFVGPLLDEVAQGSSPHFEARYYQRCRAAELRALVSPAGVFLCPRHQALPVARYGDSVTRSLAEIWGSEEHKNALNQVDARIHCHGACMSMDLNEKLGSAIEWVRGHDVTPPLVDDDDLYI